MNGCNSWSTDPPYRFCTTTLPVSAASIALSTELKKQGWKFVGPTTVHAFMQAMGLINDHVEDCMLRAKAEAARKRFKRPCR